MRMASKDGAKTPKIEWLLRWAANVSCGYDRCHEALDFHHLDPSVKERNMGNIRANPIAWDKIVIELRKCVLLCANCHREHHAGILETELTESSFNEDYVSYKAVFAKLRDTCPVCKDEKTPSA